MNVRRFVLMCGVILLALAVVPLDAHEYTFKGKVVSIAPKSIQISVVDEKTHKTTLMAFEIDKDTKILRGDAVVTFAEAKIQKDEQAAVTVNNDDGGGDYAMIVRLAVGK